MSEICFSTWVILVVDLDQSLMMIITSNNYCSCYMVYIKRPILYSDCVKLVLSGLSSFLFLYFSHTNT